MIRIGSKEDWGEYFCIHLLVPEVNKSANFRAPNVHDILCTQICDQIKGGTFVTCHMKL